MSELPMDKFQRCHSSQPFKLLLLNDTRRDLGHVGCTEVIRTIDQLCMRHGMKIIKFFMADNLVSNEAYQKSLNGCDGVILNGEGSLRDCNKKTINLLEAAKLAKDKGKTTFLINTQWHDNNRLEGYISCFDYIVTRDIRSRRALEGHNVPVEAICDYSLYYINEKTTTKTIKDRIIITDSVIKEKSLFLYTLSKLLSAPFKNMNYGSLSSVKKAIMSLIRKSVIKTNDSYFFSRIVQRIFIHQILYLFLSPPFLLDINNIKGAGIVITGRFHAVMLCCKYGIPFLAVQSNTPKIENFLRDVGLDPSYLMLSYSPKGGLIFSTEVIEQKIYIAQQYWQTQGCHIVQSFIERKQKDLEMSFIKMNSILISVKKDDNTSI